MQVEVCETIGVEEHGTKPDEECEQGVKMLGGAGSKNWRTLTQGADLKLSLRGCWGSKLNMGQIGIEPNRWVASRPLEAYVPISVDRHIPRSSRH